MVEIMARETKKKDQRKAKRHNPHESKKKKELITFMVENYFTHNLFNVTCMQIMRSNNNGRLKTSIILQCNFPLSIAKAKTH